MAENSQCLKAISVFKFEFVCAVEVMCMKVNRCANLKTNLSYLQRQPYPDQYTLRQIPRGIADRNVSQLDRHLHGIHGKSYCQMSNYLRHFLLH